MSIAAVSYCCFSQEMCLNSLSLLVCGLVGWCVRAFCVEKNSAAPDVQLKGASSTAVTLVVPYVEFVLTEVIKNSLQVSSSNAVK